MAKKFKVDADHYLEVVKLMFVFSSAITVFIFVFAFSIGFNRLGRASAEDPISVVSCPEIYSPVCGTDQFTYPNGCIASKANIEIECNGECPCGDGDSYEVDPPLVY